MAEEVDDHSAMPAVVEQEFHCARQEQKMLGSFSPGMVSLLDLSSASALSVEFVSFEQMCARIQADGAQELSFAPKWMQWQSRQFQNLSLGQQSHLESLPGWTDIAAQSDARRRRRVPMDRIMADLKAYSESHGLHKLFESASAGTQGLREALLRQWSRRLREDYKAAKLQGSLTTKLKIKRAAGLHRMTTHRISELESLPGWRWSFREPRGSYKKKEKKNTTKRAAGG